MGNIKRSLISASIIKSAIKDGIAEITVLEDAIITDEARDLAARAKINLIRKNIDLAGSAESKLNAEHRNHLAIGSDHGGYELKEYLKIKLQEAGYSVLDAGCFGKEAVDYPDFAARVGRAVRDSETARGIMIDSIGVASAMVCNRFSGVRAAACESMKSAMSSRRHNNANIITFGATMISQQLAEEIVLAWMQEPYDGGRHEKRVQKIMQFDS
jgi:ribose 5-phosphate isomerase B